MKFRRSLLSYRCSARRLLNVVEFAFCFNQDGDIRIGIFPEGEKILIRLACLCSIALHRGGSCERQVRQWPQCRKWTLTTMLQNPACFRSGLSSLAQLQINEAAQCLW